MNQTRRVLLPAMLSSFIAGLLLADPPSEHAPSIESAALALPPSPPSPKPRMGLLSLDSETLTGGWGGSRGALEARGVRVHTFLNHQYQAVLKGGADTTGSGASSASWDALVTFDLEKMGMIDHAEALLHLQANWGDGINRRSGSLVEVNDDADGDLGLHVAQLWYRHHFAKRKASLALGFLDYQTIVDRNVHANSEDKQFLNQALDNNPLVPLTIGLGAVLTLQPIESYSIIIGAGDAQSVLYKPGFSTAFHEENGWFAYMEHGLHVRFPSDRGPLDGNYRIGVVYDPRPRVNINSGTRRPRSDGDDYGIYASIDQRLYRESEDNRQGLGVFGRFGYRTEDTNRLARFWSGGFAYKGLLSGRDEDELGFGFAWLEGSNAYRNRVDPDFDREVIYELYYAIQMTRWLVVTPDLQYIDNPGAWGEHGHAFVGGVRVRISF